VLWEDKQLDAAEEAASQAVDLLLEKGEQFRACQGHRVLGNIYSSKGDTEKAIHHFEAALGIASSLNDHTELFCIHYVLAGLDFKQGRFDDARAHAERAKSHAGNDTYNLGRAVELQAILSRHQHMFERARLEASRAADIFEKLGVVRDLERCRELLREIDKLDPDGEFLETMLLPAHIDFSF
jgi:tetratricopeptide (TPR) repeat protein